MSLQSVTIAGQSVGVIDVTTHSRGGDSLSAATLVVKDTESNRAQATHGAEVVVEWTEYTWRGYVTNPQAGEGAETLQIKANGRRLELKHNTLHTCFYNVTSSEAVKLAITTRSKPLNKTEIHTGSTVTDWTAVAPVKQRYGGSRASLYNWGTDGIIVGARSGHDSPLVATYHNVTTDAIVDGIYRLDTRLLVSDRFTGLEAEIELTTPDDTTYVWEPELNTGPQSLRLNAEDAHPDGQVSEAGTLQYRFYPGGRTANDAAVMIDNAHTLPFKRVPRNTALSVDGVQSTNRKIIRRVDNPAAVFIDKQATEDGFDWWVDDDILYYEPGENDPGELEIVAGETPVIDVSPDRDAESITNIVTVVGANDIEVTERDQASIEYYGPVPRPEPITDPSLTTKAEATARAKGHLEDNAWDDAEIPFEVADTRLSALTHGDSIPIDYPPEGLSGSYSIEETRTQSNGVVTVTVAASSGRGDY